MDWELCHNKACLYNSMAAVGQDCFLQHTTQQCTCKLAMKHYKAQVCKLPVTTSSQQCVMHVLTVHVHTMRRLKKIVQSIGQDRALDKNHLCI